MKYLLKEASGVWSIREDSGPLPIGAVPLTDAQYDGLFSGALSALNGIVSVTPTPAPAGTPPYIS